MERETDTNKRKEKNDRKEPRVHFADIRPKGRDVRVVDSRLTMIELTCVFASSQDGPGKDLGGSKSKSEDSDRIAIGN